MQRHTNIERAGRLHVNLNRVCVCSQFRMLSSLNCRAFFYDSEAQTPSE